MDRIDSWPGDAQAVVSLTYDDGMGSGLDHAIPDLESAGFRGTFYLPVGNIHVSRGKEDWKRAFLAGHEIGSHSVRHPCRGSNHKHNLEGYTPVDILKEILSAASWLNRNVGVDAYRTFAYPCGHVAIGDPPNEGSYSAAVQAYHFAARIVGGGINDSVSVAENPLRIKAAAIGYPHGREVAPFIEYCEEAVRLRGWAVIVFHGIGDNWIPTERVVHQELIEYLQDGRFWVAPVREVARYILHSK
jgi:peptidoglycan-N-acetylglucosamine deacetylase